MNIFSREEKKVEYLELVYDLIFVYMTGRDNSLLENVEGGFVTPGAFLTYIICTLSIIQIWNFTTFYINMFGRNSLRDHVFLLINMYLVYFVGEATRLDSSAYIAQYHIAWGLILANVGLQYLLELRNHGTDVWNRDVIRRMSITLFVEAAMVIVAGMLAPVPSTVLSLIAIIAGVILTFVGRASSVGGQVDFMHLTERAMLYVVFTFGEMVIGIAGYFTGGGHFNLQVIYYSLMAFLVAVGMFLSYEIVYDYLVNREGEYDGMLYMMIHIFIVFALNNVTVSFAFMREEEVALFPKVMLLTVSIVAYFLFLFLLGGHFRLRCRLNRGFILKMTLLSAAFIVLMILFRDMMVINILISVLYAFAVFLVLYRMKKIFARVPDDI